MRSFPGKSSTQIWSKILKKKLICMQIDDLELTTLHNINSGFSLKRGTAAQRRAIIYSRPLFDCVPPRYSVYTVWSFAKILFIGTTTWSVI